MNFTIDVINHDLKFDTEDSHSQITHIKSVQCQQIEINDVVPIN